MNILYLHGMASSHESVIASYLRHYLPQHHWVVPDLSIDPSRAFPLIDRLIADEHIDLLIGHSLGGFMAQKYYGVKKILINPCLGTTFFRLFKGQNKYKHPRHDGVGTYTVTKAICKAYKRLEHGQYRGVTLADDRVTWGLFARHDFYTRLSSHRYQKHYSHRLMIPGGHFPTEQTLRDYVVPVIRQFDSDPAFVADDDIAAVGHQSERLP